MRLTSTLSALGSVPRGSASLAMLACLAVIVLPATDALGASRASSQSVQAILEQCPSGQLSGHYTLAQLQQAQSIMPAYTRQYTSCPDVVQEAIIGTQHHRGNAAAIHPSGSFLPTPIIAVLLVLIVGAGALGCLELRRR